MIEKNTMNVGRKLEQESQIDLLAIGDITTDAFIRLEQASVHCDVDHHNCQLCMSFGDKIPYEFVEVVKAVGNAPNAAVSGARLGLQSVLAANVGDDLNGRECLATLRENGIVGVDNFVKINPGRKTNYHYVLWYEDERTILVKHEAYEYLLPEALNLETKGTGPRWIYLTSLGEASLPFHDEIATYLKNHPETRLAFQPGTYQMKFGHERLSELYRETDIFFCNTEEAQRILNITDPASPDATPISLLQKIHALGPRIVVITDGPKGAYAFDGQDQAIQQSEDQKTQSPTQLAQSSSAWFMPPYPDPKPPYERTGAGDAFSSTFVAAIALGKSLEEALRWAPINPMSVVQFIGAQKGLLTRSQLEECLSKAPADYRPRKI